MTKIQRDYISNLQDTSCSEQDNYLINYFHEGKCQQINKYFSPHPKLVKGVCVWVFRVWAPHAKAVSVVGDFNQWNSDCNPMSKISDSVWETEIAGLKVFDSYKYAIKSSRDEIVFKADPYALHAETAPANASKLYTSNYKWKDSKWLEERQSFVPYDSPINIYEMHLGSWKKHSDGNPMTYRQIADDLAQYASDMNYTHVEILPVTEFPYEGSWGYQVTGMFAPTSRFGTPDDFKYFVDTLHRKGIGVILDWVVAHFPKDAFGLYEFDGERLYEYQDELKCEHKEWGTRIFDYSKNEVKSFLISSADYWIREYHIDGIRVDAVASMLYLDYGRKNGEWRPNVFGGNYNLEAIDFFKQLNSSILSQHSGVIMIAEESTSFPLVTKPSYDGGLGFNFKWNMGWMNDLVSYMGVNPFFRKDCHNHLTFSITYAFSENYILPLSHDEVVHGKLSLLNKLPGEYNEKFDGLKSFLGYMIAHPGKKLLFMGGEFGQFIEWDYAKQLDWFLLDYDSHKNLHKFVKDLNSFYVKNKPLYELDTIYDGFEWIVVDDNSQNIVCFIRRAKNGDFVIAIVNFSPVDRYGYCVGVPQEGTYKISLDSSDVKYGGKSEKAWLRLKSKAGQMHNQQQFIRLDLVGNSVMFIKKVASKKTTK